MRDRPSPNHDDRRGCAVDMIVIHYTGMESAAVSLDRLCDPDAKVSAHYLIDEDGAVDRLVTEDRRAWHAGVAFWAGERDVNARSVGIELQNPGHEFGYRPFPEPQIAALTELAADIAARHAVPPARVVGHADVAPLRKQDPGELFPWPRLAALGLGLWPERWDPSRAVAEADVPAALARIGYGWLDGPDADIEAVLRAFQRHWRPADPSGRADAETLLRIGNIAPLTR